MDITKQNYTRRFINTADVTLVYLHADAQHLIEERHIAGFVVLEHSAAGGIEVGHCDRAQH